jgi:hypothetical protein
MSNRSWSFTSIEDGRPVETLRGLSHDEAVEAIRAAMYGGAPALREIAARKNEEDRAATPLAA